jgi:hypothetical protein
VVHTLARAEWGEAAPGLSTLERTFLSLIGAPALEVTT